ncbi:MAG TPA: carboxypeptidase regulatory-like domain-containing protein [Desulfomonilia bacterium]|nr:carboxypeptidase regulatory-like domain-containing protein [Desulfomonilia bacterium]
MKFHCGILGSGFFTATNAFLLLGMVVILSGCSSGGGSTPQFIISGTVSGDIRQGITITLSGSGSQTTETDADGNYTFAGITNGTYGITPAYNGYLFNSTSRIIRISGANATAVDFTSLISTTGPHNISGTVTADNGAALYRVTMTLSGTSSGTVLTDANGDYAFDGLADGNYTVTPSLSGYILNPINKILYVSGSDATGINFTADKNPTPTYNLSGTVTQSGTGLPGVTITLVGTSPATVFTDEGGRYTFPGLQAGTYSIHINKSGYTFSPESRSLTVRSADILGANFTADQGLYSISGRIIGAGAGVTVTLGGNASASTSTDATGNYSFTGLANGSYNVTPSLTGYVFTPTILVVGISNANAAGINFISSRQ